jgi:hypothetical protein
MSPFKNVVVLTILLGSAEISSAATISQDQLFGPLAGPSSSTTLNYDLFDPSQGILTKFLVDITSEVSETIGATFTASINGFPNTLSIVIGPFAPSTNPTDVNISGLSSFPFDAFVGVGTFPLHFSYSAVNCAPSCGDGWSGDLKLTYVFDPVSQTPLPAALPLFATGLGALGVIGRRRKKKSAAVAA